MIFLFFSFLFFLFFLTKKFGYNFLQREKELQETAEGLSSKLSEAANRSTDSVKKHDSEMKSLKSRLSALKRESFYSLYFILFYFILFSFLFFSFLFFSFIFFIFFYFFFFSFLFFFILFYFIFFFFQSLFHAGSLTEKTKELSVEQEKNAELVTKYERDIQVPLSSHSSFFPYY